MKLRDLRNITGISRAELERRAGLPSRKLEHYESGDTSQNLMPIGIAYKVAKVLKIKIDDLLENEEENKK